MEPWSDYLAIPVAPFLLLVQVATLFVPRWPWRWGIACACTTSIVVMLFYVDSIPVAPAEGVNIGAGVLYLWVLVSVFLLAALGVRELLVGGFRGIRSSRRRAAQSERH